MLREQLGETNKILEKAINLRPRLAGISVLLKTTMITWNRFQNSDFS